ncbi:MAG: choice-of-anchor D domain-containing protein, partial [Candidatus Acidiferrum sp.]
MFSTRISQVARHVACLLLAISVRVRRRIGGMKMSTLCLGGIAVLAITLLAAGMPVAAQTAHFDCAIRTLGSGGSIFNPAAMAVDGSGNIFVIAGDVYEVPAAGGYSTVKTLGIGFNTPHGLAVDGSGNVFVADTYNNAVKEILAAGGYTTINTLVSGSSLSLLPQSVMVDLSGNVFFSGGSIVAEILAVNGSIPPNPTIHSLGFLDHDFALAVDASGNIFAADAVNNAVKEILAASGYQTVKTLGSGFNNPHGLAVDASGNVFVADTGNNAVKEILAAGGYTTIITRGSGFSGPTNVGVDASGNVFVQDSGNYAMKGIFAAGGNFGPVSVASPGSFPISYYFTFDTAGTLGSTAVLTQGAAGLDFTDAGSGNCTAGTAYSAGDTCTVNVTFNPTAPGPRHGAVELLDGSGNLLTTGYVQGTGIGPLVNFLSGTQSTLGSGFNFPTGVAVDASGNVFVAEGSNKAVKEILAAGGYTTVNTLGSGFNLPTAVAVDGSGNVFVTDQTNNAVKEILAAGGYATVSTLGSGFNLPTGAAVDGSGNVFVADYGNSAVKEILAAGGYGTVNTLGSGFRTPIGVAVDGSGNVFVADYGNSAVKEILAVGGSILPNPTIITLASGFAAAIGVAVDGNGNVFVADRDNNAVKKILAVNGSIPPNPTVITLGSGFNSPYGVAVDASGNVFVADTADNRVEKLDYADPPALSFARGVVGSLSSDSPQTVTVSNNGNADLKFQVSAANNPSISSGFMLDNTTTCPQLPQSYPRTTLAPGASCAYAVDFVPATTGANSGSMVLMDNNLNAPGPNYTTQSVGLSGTGVTPYAALAPGNLTFDAQVVGTSSASQTLTLSNSDPVLPLTISDITITGANAGDFRQTNACGASLAGGMSCQIQVSFRPLATSNRALSARLTVYDNSGGLSSTQTAALSGRGAAAYIAALAPEDITFSAQVVGTSSAPQTVTLSNSSSSQVLWISYITIYGANFRDFSQTNACDGTLLESGTSCQIQVTFRPSVGGPESATLIVYDTTLGLSWTQTVALSGTGLAPAAALAPGNLTFSAQLDTSSAPQTVTLSNSGPPLTISGISITGANVSDFRQTNACSASLAGGANCQIQVTFAPSAVGVESATLTITDDSGGVHGSTQTVALSGT